MLILQIEASIEIFVLMMILMHQWLLWITQVFYLQIRVKLKTRMSTKMT